MPRGLEPGLRGEFVLKCDLEKPDETRPTFEFRYLSSRKASEALRMVDDIKEGLVSAEEGQDIAANAIALYLTGWKNMVDPETGEAIPYDIQSLRDILTYAEIWELFYGLHGGGNVSTDDKKK